MQTVKQYVSCDGQIFDDRFACARHEFATQPDLLGKLNTAFGRYVSKSSQSNWCGGDPDVGNNFACACMGCANGTFYTLGLQYEHWKVWLDELRQPSDTDIPTINDDVDVILTNIGPNRIDTFKAIRQLTGLGMVETKSLMDLQNAVIKRDVYFYDGAAAVDLLESVGATCKLEITKKGWTK